MIHLYCLAVQAGFYRDVVECSLQDRRVSRFDPRPGHENFLRVRDITIITYCKLKNGYCLL